MILIGSMSELVSSFFQYYHQTNDNPRSRRGSTYLPPQVDGHWRSCEITRWKE